jgi:hypothetical protein
VLKRVELRAHSLYKFGVRLFVQPRRSRLRYAVVVALLFGGLALAEFPELLQLKDDTSNDFTLVVSKAEASPASYIAKFGATPAAILIGEGSAHTRVSEKSGLSFTDPIVQSSVDYLHLLCVHRT